MATDSDTGPRGGTWRPDGQPDERRSVGLRAGGVPGREYRDGDRGLAGRDHSHIALEGR